MSTVRAIIEPIVTGTELVGAAIMVGGGALTLARQTPDLLARRFTLASYRRLRADLGRMLLVGLEVLIVADVVRTIAVEATLESVAVLAVIVLIRTVLSFSLDVEIDGRLPWRREDRPPGGGGDEG